jgi:hypothetical protein
MIRNQSEFAKDFFQVPAENEGFTKRSFLKVVAFATLGMAPFLNTCGLFGGGDTNQAPRKKPVSPAIKGPIAMPSPPIDLAIPAKIETATFALG